MEFEYSNKWHGISKVNINAGDTWEYLGITNKYLNSVFNKIDDGKKDENGYREVSEKELSILEKLFKIISERTGYTRFFDNDFQEMEKIIDEGQIEGIPKRNPSIEENDLPQYRENVTHHYQLTKQDLEDIKSGKTDIETIRQKYIDKIKEDLKQYNNYSERFPEGRYEVDVIYNGKYFESFVYDKEFESFKKSDPQRLKRAINEFEDGNFDAINTIENPVEFIEAYRKKSGGKTLVSALISSYQEGKLSSDKLKECMWTLEKKFTEFEQEYNELNPDNNFKNGYSWLFGKYYALSSRIDHHISSTEQMKYKYEHDGLDKEQVKELQKFIKDNYNVELNEYITARIIEQGTMSDYGIYEYDFEELKNYYKNLSEEQVKYSARWNLPYTKDDVDKNKIIELQKLFKDEYNKDISETDAAHKIKSYRRQFKTGFNLEKLKLDMLNGKLFEENHVKDFKEYLENRLSHPDLGVRNDSLESIEQFAQATEQEYGRYKFDIRKSQVADLASQSEKMIKLGEKELKVIKTDDKITIKNKSTGEERVIDLKQLTSELDDKNKQTVINALGGFNNVSLWEFAIEVTNRIGTDVDKRFNPLAQYRPENDTINLSTKTEEKISAGNLLHEMCHAMMSTVIDGKNTMNEPLFKEFVDTYKEEQDVYRKKELRNDGVDRSNYTYCAQNIHEFAAEAGCLWLSGKSTSEFTIATHFPKSYRLFVQLIEKIRAQKTGRSIN